MTRARSLHITTVLGLALVTLTGCLPVADPSTTTPTNAPAASTPAAPETSDEAATPTESESEDIVVPIRMPLSGNMPAVPSLGYSTNLFRQDEFTATENNTFPEGPTIEVVESTTGCTFSAVTEVHEVYGSDEEATAALVDSILAEDETASEAESSWFNGIDAADTEVEFAMIITNQQGLWAVRGYGELGLAQVLTMTCPNLADEIPTMATIRDEHIGVRVFHE